MLTKTLTRLASTLSQKTHHKFIIVGAGSGGLGVACQLYNQFRDTGVLLEKGDVAIVDGAEWHHYQPGWTLVGSGLTDKTTLRRKMVDLIPPHIAHHPSHATSFTPQKNTLTTSNGASLTYDYLILSPGLQINWSSIPNLPEALSDPNSGVTSNYSYDTCDKTARLVKELEGGKKAVFTQPAGVIKCPGAPQKIMWMAWDQFRRTGRKVDVEFITGMPTMFTVPKYSDALNALRITRHISGRFEHNLTSINPTTKTAFFKSPTSSEPISVPYDLLHVTPPMGPLDVIKNSDLGDAVGWVDVDKETLQHRKYENVWGLGDGSSLPTSRTAAAITSQAPILVENLVGFAKTGKVGNARYDGYASCPLLTGYNEVMLAEFIYGFKPKETFNALGIDQATPRRVFWHLKKDFFPWIYFDKMVKGEWYGTNGWTRPSFN